VSFGKISTLHILDLKELKIFLSKTSSGGKGSQNDILSMSRLIWLPTFQKMLSVRRGGPRIFSSTGLMVTVSQRHRLTLRIGLFMEGIDRQYGCGSRKTDVFVAVDGSSTNPHRVRKTSTKEYYDPCGYNQATDKRRRWIADNNRAR
jgi:hypothetical protein